jgi:hypothetical protein
MLSHLRNGAQRKHAERAMGAMHNLDKEKTK